MIHLGRMRGRGLVALGAALGLLVSMAPAAGATVSNPGAFIAGVTGGEIEISAITGENNLGGLPACSNGTDDELIPPFGLGPDTFIDYPADPDCAESSPGAGDGIADNSETTPGFQAPTAIGFGGAISGAGAITVPAGSLVWPSTDVVKVVPPYGPMLIQTAWSQPNPWSGTLDPDTGAATLNMDLMMTANVWAPGIFGPGNIPPAAPGLVCNVYFGTDPTVPGSGPLALTTDDPGNAAGDERPLGRRFNSGVGRVGLTNFNIAATTGPHPLCGGFSPAFGLPSGSTSDIEVEMSVLSPGGLYSVGPDSGTGAAPVISIGDGVVVESGGAVKVVVPITSTPAPTADTTMLVTAAGGTATAGVDYKAVVGKTVKLKAGKTATKVAITVYGDAADEPDEDLLLTLSSVTPGGVLGDSVGEVNILDDDEVAQCSDGIDNETPADTFIDFPADPQCASPSDDDESLPSKQATTDVALQSVSIGDAQVYEGDLLGKTVKATLPVSLNGVAAADTLVYYCTAPAMVANGATETTDYKAVAGPMCTGTMKIKTIKATKSSTAVSVSVYQDVASESAEVLSVLITGTTAPGGAADYEGRVTIVSDDA